uniref:Uncharacterized protein n=1 Tax=Clastoptera arizonana TaxID=38151 RepID=A0A1B6DZD4_9HEMI
MEPLPMVFCKTYEERLAEFMVILHDENVYTLSNKVKNSWTLYLEFYMEGSGWEALWKISRELCCELKIRFPTTVVVLVEGVNFSEFTASVSITHVENAINIPKKFEEVPLIELFVLANQDNNNVISYRNIAEAIDNLRIFYCHLFYPWEVEDEDDSSWVQQHLKNRLTLYYEKITYKIFHETMDELTNLIDKGTQIYCEIKDLENQVADDDINSVNNVNTLKLFQLHHKLEYVKNKLSIFDNDVLRNLRMQENRKNIKALRQNHANFALVALVAGTAGTLKFVFDKINHIIENGTFVRPLSSLQDALNELLEGSTVLISPGLHKLYNSRGLEESNILLKGIEGEQKCVISEAEDNFSLLDTRGTEITLEDLTITGNNVKYLIIIRQGIFRLNNVKLEGCLSSTVGVIVHRGATLIANKCSFISCNFGIIAASDSVVNLNDCVFNKNKVAIKVTENSDVEMSNCTISDSKEYALQINQRDMPRKEGSLELIRESIIMSDVKLNNNFGDVLMEQIEPIQLVKGNKTLLF